MSAEWNPATPEEIRAAVAEKGYCVAVEPSTPEQRATRKSPNVTVWMAESDANPVLPNAEIMSEQAKYREMWSHEQYRSIAPGEQIAPEFLNIARPRNGAKIIDFGSGTGRGSRAIAILANVAGIDVDIEMLDFADNALDEDVAQLCKQDGTTKIRFTQHDLTKPVPMVAEYGFNTDVMEHIPPEQVDLVLTNILQAARHVFFQISCVDDACGKLIGHALHLSVHEPSWWKKKFEDLGCTIHYWRDDTESCIAYVTAWSDGQDVVDVGMLNIAEEKIRENVRANLAARFYQTAQPSDAEKAEVFKLLSENEQWRNSYESAGITCDPSVVQTISTDGYTSKVHFSRGKHEDYWLPVDTGKLRTALRAAGAPLDSGWHQVMPHAPQSTEVMIVGGGPSLAGQLDTIRRMRFEGKKLVTLNGAYNWAIEHGLEVSATVVVDARPHNARFTKPVQPSTIYLMGSQVDPSVLEGLPKDRTLLWHTTAESIRDILEEECPGKWFGVPGGSTVLLRTIPLLRMLGYSRFHLFGVDSCVSPKYAIKDRKTGRIITGTFNGKEEQLVYDTREMAERLAPGCEDYGHDPEVVEFPAHHAYPQPENTGAPVFPATVGGRVFSCTAAHCAQAQEFMNLIRIMGDMFELEVHGDGLLGWILQHGAQMDIDLEEAREGSER